MDLAVGTRVAGMVGGFDRDFGTYAEQLVVPAADVAVVPDGLDLVGRRRCRSTGWLPRRSSTCSATARAARLLVTGAAGAVGGYVASLARDRGWQVTGLARAEDEEFVRSLGADFTADAEPGWDAVADGAVLQERAVALVRDGGRFVGVRPAVPPATQRGVTIAAVGVTRTAPDLAGLLARTARGELPARGAAIVPLDRVAEAHPAVAKGGVRGRYVLRPDAGTA